MGISFYSARPSSLDPIEPSIGDRDGENLNPIRPKRVIRAATMFAARVEADRSNASKSSYRISLIRLLLLLLLVLVLVLVVHVVGESVYE